MFLAKAGHLPYPFPTVGLASEAAAKVRPDVLVYEPADPLGCPDRERVDAPGVAFTSDDEWAPAGSTDLAVVKSAERPP